MRLVNITVEKRMRLSMDALVTEQEFRQIKTGESPLLEILKKELDLGNGYAEYDYAVTDEKGNTIIDWD